MRMLQLSYNNSMAIRGIAILLMIYLHCFNYHPADDYVDWMWRGKTISWWLTRTAQFCVPLYCMLSGYGLYKKYPYGYKYCIEKSWSLIKRYWFYLSVFLFVGYYAFDAYIINTSLFLSNFLGYETTYNPTLWFLLPYLIILLASPYLLKLFHTYNVKYYN